MNTNSSALPVEDVIRLALLKLTIAAEEGDANGVAQVDLAKDLGIARQSISKLVHGELRFRLEYLPRLRDRAFHAVMSAIQLTRSARPAVDSVRSTKDLVQMALDAVAHINRRLDDNELSVSEEISTDLELQQIEAQIQLVRKSFQARRAPSIAVIR